MPTTSYPSDFNSAAVTEESTPPDIATTTLVSCGRPSISRLLSMFAVTDAVVARLRTPFSDWEACYPIEAGCSRWEPSCAPAAPGNGCKAVFNIGRLPRRQSKTVGQQAPKRQILPGGRKSDPTGVPPRSILPPHRLDIISFFKTARMAPSLLPKGVSSFWKRPTVVRVMSDITASTSYQAAPPKPARVEPTQGFDSFGSLVDSNVPPEPRPSTSAQAAPQRPSSRAA